MSADQAFIALSQTRLTQGACVEQMFLFLFFPLLPGWLASRAVSIQCSAREL